MASAPEFDHAIVAPEHRGDDFAPEAVVASGLQTSYDASSPEARVPTSSNSIEKPSIATSSRRFRKTTLALAVLVVVLVAAILGMGLGLGLGRRGNDNTSATRSSSTASVSTGITSSTPAASNTQVSHTPTPQPLKQGILNDTSIAALSLSNGDRSVVFQEKTGSLREAVYYSEAKTWVTDNSSNFYLTSTNARKKTPLAIYHKTHTLGEERDSWVVFYVSNEQDLLSCTGSNSSGCWIFDNATMPNITIASDSRHLFAQELSDSWGEMLLVYEDLTRTVNMLHLFTTNTTTGTSWKWHNVTDKFESSIKGYHANVDLIGPCATSRISRELYMLCLATDRNTSTSYIIGTLFSISSPGHLEIAKGAAIVDLEFEDTGQDPNQLDYCMLAEGNLLWFNGTKLQISFAAPGDVPVPNTLFPYHRVGSAFGVNATQSYIYHQLTESTFAEEIWVDNGFWLPSTNISIKTS